MNIHRNIHILDPLSTSNSTIWPFKSLPNRKLEQSINQRKPASPGKRFNLQKNYFFCKGDKDDAVILFQDDGEIDVCRCMPLGKRSSMPLGGSRPCRPLESIIPICWSFMVGVQGHENLFFILILISLTFLTFDDLRFFLKFSLFAPRPWAEDCQYIGYTGCCAANY